jgi:hypothetical protein
MGLRGNLLTHPIYEAGHRVRGLPLGEATRKLPLRQQSNQDQTQHPAKVLRAVKYKNTVLRIRPLEDVCQLIAKRNLLLKELVT